MRQKLNFPLNLQLFAEDPEVKPEAKTPEKKAPEEGQTVQELVKALQKVKAESVSREEFEKVQKENRELTKAIIEGSPVPQSNKPQEKKPELKELAKACLEDGISNLEYAKRAMAYRDAVIDQKGVDPFVPNKHDVSDNDIERAQAVAEAYKECIEECDGNPEVFNALIASKIKNDDPITLATLYKRNKK